MKKTVGVAIAALLISSATAWARPSRGTVQRTQTGPGSYSTSGTGPAGGQVNANSQVTPTRNGVRATGQGTVVGPKGSQAQGSGTVEGNQQKGTLQGQGSVQGVRGGQASGQTKGSWSNGTYNGTGTYEYTTPQGQTGSGSTQSTYTQGQGGSTTITNSQGESKTVTVPPAPEKP